MERTRLLPSSFTLHPARQRRQGLVLAALSVSCFASMAVLVRVLSSQGGYNALQLMCWRGTMQTLLAILGCLSLKKHPFRVPGGWLEYRWVLLQALLDCAGHLLYFAALTHLSMGKSTVLFFTNPLFAVLLAAPLLNESITGRIQALGTVCLVGVLLVVLPASLLSLPVALLGGSLQWSICALAGAASVALSSISIGLAGGPIVHQMVYLVYFGLVSSVGCLVASLASIGLTSWHFPSDLANEWLALIGIGIAGFLAQYLMHRGLQQAPINSAMMIRNAGIPIIFILDALVFYSLPSTMNLIGAIIVTGSIVWMNVS